MPKKKNGTTGMALKEVTNLVQRVMDLHKTQEINSIYSIKEITLMALPT